MKRFTQNIENAIETFRVDNGIRLCTIITAWPLATHTKNINKTFPQNINMNISWKKQLYLKKYDNKTMPINRLQIQNEKKHIASYNTA